MSGPINTLLVVGSTLKNGVVLPRVESTCNFGASNVFASNLYVSVPATVIPITSVLDLNKPVVVELSNAREGAAAVPSANLAVV